MSKIASLRLHPVAVDRQYGTVIAQEGGEAKRTVARSQFFFLEVKTEDGRTGWGEISDIEPDELPADPQEYGRSLAPLVVGRSPFDIQQLHHDIGQHMDLATGSLPRCTSCALDMAMYDLQGQITGLPVYQLLGGAVRKRALISWVAYIREDLELIREEIRQRTAQGFRAFKLKVGLDIDLDEERLAIARQVAGREASIKVDANEGWTVSTAPKNIRRLNRFHLAGVETPVPRENPTDIAAVRKQVDVPILEHVHLPEYGLALIKAEAVDAFNVATTGAGGLWPARTIVSLAEAAGLDVLLGSTVEMGPGTLAQLHLAATVRNLTIPSDLIGPGMYKADVLTQPLVYREGHLDIPTGPGLGGEVDRVQLRRLASQGAG